MPSPRALAPLLAVVLAALPIALARTPALGQTACGPSPWRVENGSLHPGARCGTWVGDTDALSIPFSFGLYRYTTPLRFPYEATVTLRRLSPDGHRSMELWHPGGVLLVRDGQYGVYTTEAAFERRGWQPLRGFRSHEEHTLTLRQDLRTVSLTVDGRAVGAFPAERPPEDVELGIGFKGMNGERSRILFWDFRLRMPQGQ
jgi:hypothetical protein